MSQAPHSLGELKEVVDQHRLITHPYLSAFREGRLSYEDFVYWVKQQYHFSVTFGPSCDGLRIHLMEMHGIQSDALDELVSAETWHSGIDGTHGEHFLDLADYCNLAEGDLERQELHASTRAFCSMRRRCFSTEATEAVLLAALGNEHLNTHLFAAYREGVDRHPDLGECPAAYFDAHLADEEADFGIFDDCYRQLREKGVVSMSHAGMILHVVDYLDQRTRFFDVLMRRAQCT